LYGIFLENEGRKFYFPVGRVSSFFSGAFVAGVFSDEGDTFDGVGIFSGVAIIYKKVKK